MRLPILLALVAASIPLTHARAEVTSAAPIKYHVEWVHDGDTFRCRGYQRSARLYAIDAPEIGACRGRSGRVCVVGDGKAAKAYLERMIAGRDLACRLLETDRYGRPVMQCLARGTDLSCAMVARGYAVERCGRLRC